MPAAWARRQSQRFPSGRGVGRRQATGGSYHVLKLGFVFLSSYSFSVKEIIRAEINPGFAGSLENSIDARGRDTSALGPAMNHLAGHA